MKVRGRVFREGRHVPVMTPVREDSYRENSKLQAPTGCPECGASYRNGRWTWQAAPADAHIALCPACQRIQDGFPAGYVTLKGAFAKAHRDEVIALVRDREAREKAEHPLQRIMAIADVSAGIEVTTTDTHLARGIAHALRAAFKGESTIRYAKEENMVRAVWERS